MTTQQRLTADELFELLWLLGQLGIGRGDVSGNDDADFIVCPTCGVAFDTRDMDEVRAHAGSAHPAPRRH